MKEESFVTGDTMYLFATFLHVNKNALDAIRKRYSAAVVGENEF